MSQQEDFLVHENGNICSGNCGDTKATHYRPHLPLAVMQVLNRNRDAVLSAAVSLDTLGKFGEFKPHMSMTIRMSAALASMSVALLTTALNPRVATSAEAQKASMVPLLSQMQQFVRELAG